MDTAEYHNLSLAIDELYDTFAHYPIPIEFDCHSENNVDRKACLKRITRDRISDFNFGDPYSTDYIQIIPTKQYKGLLPRILELIANQGYVLDFVSRFKLEGVFKNRQNFRDNEWLVVENYLQRLEVYILSLNPADITVLFPEEFFRDIGIYCEDIQSYLTVWENQLYREMAVIHLAHLMLRGVEPFYAEKDSTNAQTIKAWLIKPKMQKILEKAYWANSDDEELGALFSGAVDMYSIWVSNYQDANS